MSTVGIIHPYFGFYVIGTKHLATGLGWFMISKKSAFVQYFRQNPQYCATDRDILGAEFIKKTYIIVVNQTLFTKCLQQKQQQISTKKLI